MTMNMDLQFFHHHRHKRNNNNNHNINEDVMIEILVRLPLISVLRFKLVSKTWYALISHPNFLVRHSLHYHLYIQQTQRIDHLSDGLCFGPIWFQARQYFHFDHQPDYLIFPPPPPHPHPFPNHNQIQHPPLSPPPILKILNEDDHPLSFFPILPTIHDVLSDDHPMEKFNFFTMSSFCNGLVIFCGHDINEITDPRFQRDHSDETHKHIKHSIDSTYFLCNPVLKQYIELPRINPLLLVPSIQNENVPLHKYVYGNNDAFGENDLLTSLEPAYQYEPIILFDPTISLSYKVIRFLVRRNTDHDAVWKYLLQIHVYSQPPHLSSSPAEISTTGTGTSSTESSWRLITSFPWEDTLASNNGVLLNGVSYHLCLRREFIICFDVLKEIVWFLDCPPLPMGITRHNYRYFGECGGHLQLVAQYCDIDFHRSLTFPCSFFDVLEMEHQQQEYDHNPDVIHSTVWTLKYRVNNIKPPPCYAHILKDTDIHIMRLYKTGKKGDQEDDEEEALLMKMFPRDGKINDMMLIFNLTSNTFGELLNIPLDYCSDSYGDVFPYTMTLFPLSSSYRS